MLPFRHILLPVDFSERSLSMVRYAAALASRYQSRQSLLHVIEEPLGMPLVPDAGIADFEVPRNNVQELELYLQEFGRDELAGPCVTRKVVMGDPATEILRYARESSVDLIAMPTHGYGLFRRFLLGSVTAKVLHDADIPVLTGVHLENATIPDAGGTRRVLCAVDLKSHSKKTLRFAARLADDLQAELSVTHVIDLPDPRLAMNFGADWEQGLVRNAKDELHSLQREVGAPGDVFVKIGEPGEQVCHLASNIHTGLLVIGRSEQSGLAGRLRASAYSIVRQAPCPVLSV